MSTTSSINAGLANLLQNLSNIGSPLVSSPQVVAALEKAPPGDIVQLSEEATQLEGLNAIFGDSSESTNWTDPLAALLAPPTTSDATNPGDVLLEDLENGGSPAPSDIVQLSAAATQMAGLNQLLVQPEKLQTSGDFAPLVSGLF